MASIQASWCGSDGATARPPPASKAPRSEALYQVSMTLPGSGRMLAQSQPIEVGIQEQWHEAAASSGQIWAGYRIVEITDADAARLESWLAQD